MSRVLNSTESQSDRLICSVVSNQRHFDYAPPGMSAQSNDVLAVVLRRRGHMVRIWFPPAKSPLQTRFRQASGRSSTPIFDVLAGRFAPDLAAIPDITVALAPLHLYDELGTVRSGDAA